jgi:hypothetical protein
LGSSARVKTDNHIFREPLPHHTTARSSSSYFLTAWLLLPKVVVVNDIATFVHGIEWDEYINKLYVD